MDGRKSTAITDGKKTSGRIFYYLEAQKIFWFPHCMQFRNADRPILKLWKCGMFCPAEDAVDDLAVVACYPRIGCSHGVRTPTKKPPSSLSERLYPEGWLSNRSFFLASFFISIASLAYSREWQKKPLLFRIMYKNVILLLFFCLTVILFLRGFATYSESFEPSWNGRMREN